MSILPLTAARVEAHAAEMTTYLLLRSAPHGNRPWDRFLARVRAPSLDRRLAAGCPPGSSRVLAIRARQILSPAGRRELAQSWNHVLDLARRPPVPRTPRAPLCRSRIAAAERDVREMLTVLTGAHPIAARGAAMASGLLSDGTGPLHSRRSPLDLGAAVREATRQMNPFAGATSDGADRDSAGCYR
jgi:hypothetical protein